MRPQVVIKVENTLVIIDAAGERPNELIILKTRSWKRHKSLNVGLDDRICDTRSLHVVKRNWISRIRVCELSPIWVDAVSRAVEARPGGCGGTQLAKVSRPLVLAEHG